MSDTTKVDPPKFSEREMQLLGFVMLSLKGGAAPDVDYEKLASLAGMTNPNSAANAWRSLKKKLYEDAAPTAGATPKSTPKKPTTPRKRKGAGDKADKDDKEGQEEGPSPKKRGRPPKDKKEDTKEKAKKEENGEAGENATISMTKAEPDDEELDEII